MIDISQEALLNFFIVGIICNFIVSLLTTALYVFKLSKITTEERAALIDFLNKRKKTMDANKGVFILIHNLLFLMPFYLVWMSCIRLYYLFMHTGLYSLFMSIKRADEFSIVRLVSYELPQK